MQDKSYLQLPDYPKLIDNAEAMSAIKVLIKLGFNPTQVSRAMRLEINKGKN